MPSELDQLRRTVPDLAHLDPLSTEVLEWLDRACSAGDELMKEKVVASAEIVATIDRAIRIGAVLQRRAREGKERLVAALLAQSAIEYAGAQRFDSGRTVELHCWAPPAC